MVLVAPEGVGGLQEKLFLISAVQLSGLEAPPFTSCCPKPWLTCTGRLSRALGKGFLALQTVKGVYVVME